jgi:virginiamycin B lyase
VLRRIPALAVLGTLLAALLAAAPAFAAPAVTGEFDVPGLGNNNKLVQGPDGNIWVTLNGGTGKDVAKITPAGVVTEYDLEAVTASGITVGPEGRLWITRNGGIISFEPGNPEGTKELTDIATIGTSHSIVLGPDNNLWVATNDLVLRIPPGSGGKPGTPDGILVGGLVPKDIDVAGSLLVVADFAGSRVLTFTTDGKGDEHKVGGGVQGVAGNPNGQYAFSQPTAEPREFGLFAPGAAPIITPIPGKDPFGVALGSDGAYWAPEFNSDGLLRMTATGAVTGLPGFAKGSAPRQIAAGPDNTLWVTLETTKKVGRVSGLEPPVAPALPLPPPIKVPETKIDKGPKGRVLAKAKKARIKFRFSSPDAGASFECRMVRVTPKKAKASKVIAMAPCKSPKKYALKPGTYRFEVAAVLGGVADPTPAKRTLRVVRVVEKRS